MDKAAYEEVSATVMAALREFDAVVEVVEYLGDERLVHLRLGEKTLVAKLPLSASLQAGTTESFSVPLESIVLFEAASGEATAWGAGAG